MSDQEPTSAPAQSIFDQERPPDMKLETPPSLSLPNLWESKSWTYTDSIPHLLVPYHSVEGRGEYLVTVTLVAKADTFVPYSYMVNTEPEEVTQPISSIATRIDMENMVNCLRVWLLEEDAHKQLTFASVTVTRCTKKKYQDPLIPSVCVTFSEDYYKAEGLCECEKKRRCKEILDFFNNDKNPIAGYGSGSLIWYTDGSPSQYYRDTLPTSALQEFHEWVMRNPLYREYVSVKFSYCLWNFYHTKYVDEK